MATTAIGQEKLAALAALLARAGVVDADLEERFVRASGPGGQKVNKTSSAVYLRHGPSGIEVKAQASRSQVQNRYAARKRLAERILALAEGKKSATAQAIAKVQRQKRKRSKRAKAKVLDNKRHQGDKKQGRKRPQED
jgi:protein subunit release factor B